MERDGLTPRQGPLNPGKAAEDCEGMISSKEGPLRGLQTAGKREGEGKESFGEATAEVAHPDSGLREVGPHRDLLPHAHVRVAVPLESGLQFLQLLASKMSPLAPLLLLLRRVVRTPFLAFLRAAWLLFYKERRKEGRGDRDHNKDRLG